MVTSDYNFKIPSIGWPFNFPPNVFSSKMWTNRKYVTLAYKRPLSASSLEASILIELLFCVHFFFCSQTAFSFHAHGAFLFPFLISVTRFSEISPLWLNFKVLVNFFTACLVFCKNQSWTNFDNFYAIEQFFIVENGQMMKNYQAVWSHCFLCFLSFVFCLPISSGLSKWLIKHLHKFSQQIKPF